MIWKNKHTIFYSDLKKASQNNFYDIVYKQSKFNLTEHNVKIYENDILNYGGIQRKIINQKDRQASIVLSDQCDILPKWYHFVYLSHYTPVYVTLIHSQILSKYFPHTLQSFHTSQPNQFIIGFPDSLKSDTDKQILQFMLYRILSDKAIHLDMYGHVKIGKKAQLQYVFSNQTKNIHYFDTLVDEITNAKENLYMWNLHKKLEPRYYPQFVESSVYHSDQKIQDGIEYGEISLLYNCGNSIRKKCHERNIFSFYDDRFLNQLSNGTRKIVFRIFHLNFGMNKSEWKYIDASIEDNDDYQKTKRAFNENKILYIDLEFTPKQLYLCGWTDKDDNYSYIWDDDSNSSFMEKLLSFLKERQDYIFIYYSAEVKKLKEYVRKLGLSVDESFFNNFVDLYQLLKNYVAFRNCYNFKLKTIEKALAKQGLIETSYKDLACQCGGDSVEMFEDFKLFKCKKLQQEILEYNKIDCINQRKILNEILLF